MTYLEELLPEFRKGAKIRCSYWEPNIYIQQQGLVIINNHDVVCSLSSGDIISDRWELYQEPEPDWQYIIDNGCLCWFWDQNNDKRARFLARIIENHEAKFVDNKGYSWFKCCPVRREELTFYEGRKDDI